MFIRRRAAAEELERLLTRIPYLVGIARQHPDGVSGADIAAFSVDADSSFPLQNVINLLALGMVMLLGGLPG